MITEDVRPTGEEALGKDRHKDIAFRRRNFAVAPFLPPHSFSVDAIDVAGAGGTSWVKVDTLITGKPLEHFFEWGIPTAEALEQCLHSVKIPVIASGGIRNGIEAAKALSMGTSLVGLALPLLKPACNSAEDVKKVLDKLILELKTVMFLTGSKDLKDLKGKAVKFNT